ncbi:hypothetical protein ABBQ32_005512 [Trebouxia sp. C0010 RCD-2024]
MKLDVNSLRYLSKEEWRVLGSVELGQRNHEMVPKELIVTIANLKHAGAEVYISNLAKYKLLHKESRKYEGYRLTYLGYDFLAIHSLVKKGVINSVGRQIGVGKESDVFEVMNDEGEVLALKLHRLGRTSFRAVKSKRDYLQHRTSFSWLYLSRLAAMKEYAFMVALGEHGLPVPYAVAHNRHCVLMTLVDAVPLVQVRELGNPGRIYEQCMGMMARLAELGLVHCDFNEFNLLVSDDDELTLIDFPQMVSTSHANAQELFERDVECVLRFFKKKLGYIPEHDADLPYVRPDFQAIVAGNADSKGLDVELAASGFGQQHQEMLDRYVQESADNAHPSSHHSSESVDYKDDHTEKDGGEQSSTESESSAELSPEQPESEQHEQGSALNSSAHLARLDMDDCKASHHCPAASASGAVQTADVQIDVGTPGPDGGGGSEATPDQDTGRNQDVGSAEQLPEDLPDHVAVRRRGDASRAASLAEAAHELDDDVASVMSHSVQIPSQEAVQQRVVDQQRSRMRRQVLARASRNAQKVGNKRERKQTASSVNW